MMELLASKTKASQIFLQLDYMLQEEEEEVAILLSLLAACQILP